MSATKLLIFFKLVTIISLPILIAPDKSARSSYGAGWQVDGKRATGRFESVDACPKVRFEERSRGFAGKSEGAMLY